MKEKETAPSVKQQEKASCAHPGRRVIVAKSAGFCFGVKRAVDECYRQAREGCGPIYTYGPIIHNEQVVEDLENRGVRVLHDTEDLKRVTQGTVIIRSHGVEKTVYDQIEAQGLKLVDATCPFVKKIHRIVRERTARGDDVIIIGDPTHPEVQGICGWAAGPVTVIETEQQAEEYFLAHRNDPTLPEKTLAIVSQTTFNAKKFKHLVEILGRLRYDREDILNTICNATEERQTEARELSSQADAMIVIGGRHSSNTQKLFEICKQECANTHYIQKLVDLDLRLLPSSGCLGITAGASTPNILIEEVSKRCQK